MTLRQILTTWSTPGGGGTTVMFFDTSVSNVNAQRLNVNSLWEGIDETLTDQVSWVVELSGTELNEVNGQTTGAWSDTTPRAGVGDVLGESVADATQVLIQWRTGAFTDGREVRGRTFVPGLHIGNLVNGEIGSTALGVLNAAVTSARTNMNTAGFRIWHRPIIDPDTGAVLRNGSMHATTGASVWEELATQRRRRS